MLVKRRYLIRSDQNGVMLKKFIKYFRGDGSLFPTDYQGSYLDYLLSEIRPSVEAELDECPAHDPVLLVAMEILKKASSKPWEGEYPRPLQDSQSTVLPAEPDDDSVLEVLQSEALGGDATIELDNAAEPMCLQDIVGMAETVDSDGITIDRTAEYVAEIPLSEPTSDPENTSPLSAPSIYSQEVLGAGRVWFSLLIENDRLPLDIQLSVQDVLLARDLWLGHAMCTDDVQENGQKLLKLVEEKFNDGLFGQARILLKLFQSDASTLINNDRNLFYEDMILRLGVRRAVQLPKAVRERNKAGFSEVANGDLEKFGAAFEQLREQCQLTFNVLSRPNDAAQEWKLVVEKSQRLHAVEDFFGYWPTQRWRMPTASEDLERFEARVRESLSEYAVRDYVLGHIKVCYFILRAVGDTGMEAYLDSFFDWSESTFDYDAAAMLPELYKRTTGSDELIATILHDLYNRYFKTRAEQKLFAMREQPQRLHELLTQSAQTLANIDFNEVSPGNYNFTGLILDELFEFEYPTKEFRFKLHRLS